MSRTEKSPQVYYGLDIGGTKIELVACTEALEVCYRRRVSTPTLDYSAFLETISRLVQEADAELGGGASVGLGMPGVTDPVTGLQVSSNVPALNGRPVVQTLQTLLARPVYAGNDCQCFALSEANGGAAAGYSSMFGAILGTGAAGGYCLEGRLIRGYNGLAGEWGHWSAPATLLARYALPLLECPCGLRGCLERYVSGSGIATLYRVLAEREGDAETIVKQAEAGESAAQQVLDVHLDLLAYGLAGLILVLDPHVIVLGGGLSRLEYLYSRLPTAVAKHLFSGARVPPILPPVFGDAAGARGAALLARQHELNKLTESG